MVGYKLEPGSLQVKNKSKTNPVLLLLASFYRPWRLLHVFTFSSEYLSMFFAYVCLVRFLYEFGFGFTTLIENCSIVK